MSKDYKETELSGGDGKQERGSKNKVEYQKNGVPIAIGRREETGNGRKEQGENRRKEAE